MNNVDILKSRALELRRLLEVYAIKDDEVNDVLKRMLPLFNDIEGGKVIPPKHDDFGRYFFNVEAIDPWFIKYPELSRAEADYSEVLQGWRNFEK